MDTLRVGPEGRILAPAGADGVEASGWDATDTPGAIGGNVIITASPLVVEECGLIAAGRGGRGGSAEGFGLVAGGNGGDAATVIDPVGGNGGAPNGRGSD